MWSPINLRCGHSLPPDGYKTITPRATMDERLTIKIQPTRNSTDERHTCVDVKEAEAQESPDWLI